MWTVRAKVYIETSIVSYLTARKSGDIITSAHQQLTKDWWDNHRSRYDLFASQFVMVEAQAGDPQMAKLRVEALAGIDLLAVSSDALELGRTLVKRGPLPEKAQTDAFHIAVAASNGMDYLLTWNCKHIANAAMQNEIRRLCTAIGFATPVICTPEELLED